MSPFNYNDSELLLCPGDCGCFHQTLAAERNNIKFMFKGNKKKKQKKNGTKNIWILIGDRWS